MKMVAVQPKDGITTTIANVISGISPNVYPSTTTQHVRDPCSQIPAADSPSMAKASTARTAVRRVEAAEDADGGDVKSDDELLSDGEHGETSPPAWTISEGRGHAASDQTVAQLDGDGDDDVRYRVYRRRFFGLVQLVALNIVVSWDWLTFAAISSTSAHYYHVSETAINWLSTAFLFAFVAATPWTMRVLHRGGPRQAMLRAAGLLLLGNWIRVVASLTRVRHYGALMLGQILCGLAQPLVLAAPTRYSDLWFSHRGRVAATAVMSLANPLGGAVAQLVAPFMAGNLVQLVLLVAVVATIACIPTFFVPAGPPTPVSASSTQSKISLLSSLRRLATWPEFYLISIPFIIYVGLFNSISSLLNQMLYPYSFTEDEAGIAGAILIVVGLLFSAITSPIIDRTKAFLLALKAFVPLIAACYLVFVWAPATRSRAAVDVLLGLLGAASFSLVPIALEYLSDITHPVSPEVTSSICWAGGQLFGGIFIIVSNRLKDGGLGNDSGGGGGGGTGSTGETNEPGRFSDDGSSRPPGNMYRALVFQAVLAVIVVPLPLALGCCGRSRAVQLRRVADG